MLTNMQKQMLQVAAQNKQLNTVLAFAYLMLDVDTVQHIVQHYKQQLAPELQNIAQQMLEEMQQFIAADAMQQHAAQQHTMH